MRLRSRKGWFYFHFRHGMFYTWMLEMGRFGVSWEKREKKK